MDEKLKRAKILLIDDNPDDRLTFGRYFKDAGFFPIDTGNPLEAIELAVKEDVDCIILDYNMPSVSGIEMVRRIKNDQRLKFIPVIMFTGMDDDESIIDSITAGADDYISKSKSAKIIVARVNAAVRIKKLQDEVKIINEELLLINNELRGANEAKTGLLAQLNKVIAELRELSILDSITGLYNHGYFCQTLDTEVKRAIRYTQNICCLMLDIDYFKKINDIYGHLSGDKALEEFAQVLKKSVREIDFLARYGGEEFAILLFNVNYQGALIVAERIRGFIEGYNFNIDSHPVKLTVSIGVASLFEDELLDKEKFLSAADKALYQAKARGRNNVVKYQDISTSEFKEDQKFHDLEARMFGVTEVSRQSYLDAVKMLIVTLEERDPYTREHSINVSRYSVMMAKEMGLPENEVEVIGNAAILHDLGKIGITDSILLKKEKLTDEEFALIKRHPIIAVNLLQKTNYVRRELQLILSHHERYDGKGYPAGIKQEEIPLGSRIIAVADSYDAMRCQRSYRPALSIEKIISELVANSGTQFDPRVVEAFLTCLIKNNLIPESINIEESLNAVRVKIDKNPGT